MANDGSIEISITGDADELKKEIEAVSKLTKEHSTQAKKSSQGVKSETDTLKKSLELMGKAGKTAYNSLKTTGEVAMKSIATAATASVSVMGGVATAAVNVGKSFEAGMSTVASVSGATGAELEKLRAKAKEMGATTAFSATQATDAMNYMAMAGWKTNEMISGIDGIMNLAAASGADLATTSDIVTDALTAFGMTAKDSAEFADVMAAASSNANTNVELMGATFKYVGAAAGAMGYSIQDIAVATGLMANAGIKGEMAGTALRSTITRLAKPTKESQEAMDALGVSLTDSKGKMKSFGEIMTDMRKGMSKMTEDEKASYAAMLGGQEAMSGLLAIANASDADFAKLTKAIEGSTGAAEKMAKVKLDNLEGDITILKSGLEGFGIQIYEEMQKPLRNAAQQATDMVSDLSKAFSKDGFEGVITEGGKIISNLLTIVAQKSPKIIDVGFSFVDSIIKGIQQNSNKLTETALLMVDNIADGIKNTSTNLMPLVGDFANVFVQGVLKYKDVFWSVAFDMVTAIAQGLSDHADEISAGIVTLINNIVAKMDESLPVFIEAASNLLINVFETLAENMPDIADNLSKMLSNICETLFESLPTLFESASELIVSVFEMLAENMPDIADDIAKMIAKICKLLAKNLPKIIEAAGDFLEAFINELLGHADEIFDSVSGVISSLFNSFTKLTPKVKTIVTLMAALYAAKGVANVISAIKRVSDRVTGLFKLISANPVGAVITAVGLLAGAAVTLYTTLNSSRSTQYSQYLADTKEELEELSAQVDAVKEKCDEMKSARDEVVNSSSSEFEYYDNLWDELQGLVDQNGKVKKGYEDRVKFIEGELNRVCGENGVEWGIANGIITKNGEVVTSIKDIEKELGNLLIKSQASSLLQDLESTYNTSKESLYGTDGAEIVYFTAQNEYNKKVKEYEALSAEWEERQKYLNEQYQKCIEEYGEETGSLRYTYIAGADFVSKVTGETYAGSKGFEDAVNELYADIWGKTKGTVEEDEESFESKLKNAEDAYYEHLQNIQQYSDLNTAILKDDTEAMSAAIDNITYDFKTAQNASKEQLQKQYDDYDKAIADLNELAANGYDIDEETLEKYTEMRKGAKEQLRLMIDDYAEYLECLSEADQLAEYKKQAKAIYKAFRNDKTGNGDGWGAEIGTSLFEGIIAGLQKSSSMEDQNLAMVLDTQVRQARKALGINSPSKVTKRVLGEPMGQGITVGNVEAIKEGAKDVEKALDDDLINPLSKKSFTLSSSVILAAQQATRATAQRAASSVTTTNIHNITNNAYQQSQHTGGEKYVQESVISFERGVNDLVDFLAPKIETRTRRIGRKAVAKIG